MFRQRKFRAKKDLGLTREDFGERIETGYNTEENPDHITVHDCTFGEYIECEIVAGLESGDWEEVFETQPDTELFLCAGAALKSDRSMYMYVPIGVIASNKYEAKGIAMEKVNEALPHPNYVNQNVIVSEVPPRFLEGLKKLLCEGK